MLKAKTIQMIIVLAAMLAGGFTARLVALHG